MNIIWILYKVFRKPYIISIWDIKKISYQILKNFFFLLGFFRIMFVLSVPREIIKLHVLFLEATPVGRVVGPHATPHHTKPKFLLVGTRNSRTTSPSSLGTERSSRTRKGRLNTS
jgi:hypothetical protein